MVADRMLRLKPTRNTGNHHKGSGLWPPPPPISSSSPPKRIQSPLTGSSGAWNYCNQDQLHNLWQGPLPNKNADPLVQNNIKNFRTATAEHSIYCGVQKGSVAHVAHPWSLPWLYPGSSFSELVTASPGRERSLTASSRVLLLIFWVSGRLLSRRQLLNSIRVGKLWAHKIDEAAPMTDTNSFSPFHYMVSNDYVVLYSVKRKSVIWPLKGYL